MDKKERTTTTHTTAGNVVKWSGRVAFVLAVAVGGGWAVSLIISSLELRAPSPESAAILSTIGGVLAGGIAAYLGNTSQRDPNERTRIDDPIMPETSATSTTSASSATAAGPGGTSHIVLSTEPDESA